MGRGAGRCGCGGGDREDQGDRRAGQVPARDGRGASAGALPGPDLQREGGGGASSADRGGCRSLGGRADDGQQLPQLLPADPDRELCRCWTAGAPGRPRRGRPAAPAARDSAAAPARLPQRLGARGRGAAHQPLQGRARHARRFRRLRRGGAPRLRSPERQLRDGARSAPPPGQPHAAAQSARRLRERARERTSRGARRSPRLQGRRRDQDCRPRSPTDDRRHGRGTAIGARSQPRTTPASTPSPRPTSSTAPPSRSSA